MTKELLSAGSSESTVCLRYAHPWELGAQGLGGRFSGTGQSLRWDLGTGVVPLISVRVPSS